MGKKNRIEQVIEKVENEIEIPEIQTDLTSEDFQELSGAEKEKEEEKEDTEFSELSASPSTEEDAKFFQKAPEGKPLSALNKEIKEKMKAEGKTTRFTTAESKKTYAATRLAASLAKRGWKMNSDGVYELSGHTLNIDIEGFRANVDGYILPLGGGALKTLDQYVALSKATADQDIPSLSS